MKKRFEKWKKKSLFSKISDILIILLIVGMLIPTTRTLILSGVNNLKAKLIPPRIKTDKIAELSETVYSWQLSDIEGNIVEFSAFRDKVIFINFWATWCGPCIGEMPELQDLYNKFSDESNFVMILATTDNITNVKKFINNKKYTFPVYVIKTNTPAVFEHNSIPCSFLIDKSGGVILRQTGVANWGGAKMEKKIKSLL